MIKVSTLIYLLADTVLFHVHHFFRSNSSASEARIPCSRWWEGLPRSFHPHTNQTDSSEISHFTRQVFISSMSFEQLFTRSDPKSVKRYWRLNWNFMLLGSACIKAVLSRMLMKLTPGFYFINIFWASLVLKDPKSKKDTDDFTVFLRFWDLGA